MLRLQVRRKCPSVAPKPNRVHLPQRSVAPKPRLLSTFVKWTPPAFQWTSIVTPQLNNRRTINTSSFQVGFQQNWARWCSTNAPSDQAPPSSLSSTNSPTATPETPVEDASKVANAGLKFELENLDELPPQEVVNELDKHIVGQKDAKRAVAVAMRNRWRRRKVPKPLSDEIIPRNILMIGPTGVGKTEVARRLPN